jgi:hypothetical protein
LTLIVEIKEEIGLALILKPALFIWRENIENDFKSYAHFTRESIIKKPLAALNKLNKSITYSNISFNIILWISRQ